MTDEQEVMCEIRGMLDDNIFYSLDENDNIDGVEISFKGLAKAIYESGYRKVDGTHYVSMEWHDEQVQHAQDEIEKLKLQLQHAEENEEVLTKNAEELKKDAVREYIKSVKKYLYQLADERRCCDDCTSSWMTIDIYEFEEHLDELLEEYDK